MRTTLTIAILLISLTFTNAFFGFGKSQSESSQDSESESKPHSHQSHSLSHESDSFEFSSSWSDLNSDSEGNSRPSQRPSSFETRQEKSLSSFSSSDSFSHRPSKSFSDESESNSFQESDSESFKSSWDEISTSNDHRDHRMLFDAPEEPNHGLAEVEKDVSGKSNDKEMRHSHHEPSERHEHKGEDDKEGCSLGHKEKSEGEPNEKPEGNYEKPLEIPERHERPQSFESKTEGEDDRDPHRNHPNHDDEKIFEKTAEKFIENNEKKNLEKNETSNPENIDRISKTDNSVQSKDVNANAGNLGLNKGN